MRVALKVIALSAVAFGGVGTALANTPDPVTTGYLSTLNMIGAVKYCAGKGFADAGAVFAADALANEIKVEGDLAAAGAHARSVGERGVVFHFSAKGKKSLIPVVTLEALAEAGKTSVKDVCETYAKNFAPAAGKSKK
jgi:hypothetical protein